VNQSLVPVLMNNFFCSGSEPNLFNESCLRVQVKRQTQNLCNAANAAVSCIGMFMHRNIEQPFLNAVYMHSLYLYTQAISNSQGIEEVYSSIQSASRPYKCRHFYAIKLKLHIHVLPWQLLYYLSTIFPLNTVLYRHWSCDVCDWNT